jgi:glycosyltransferase involved in cell wall biosynthesis
MFETVGTVSSTKSAEWVGIDRPADSVSVRRVLHLINGEVFSGAERVQQLLGRSLSAFGFEPIFACLKPGKFPECSGLPEHQIWLEPMRHRHDVGVVSKLAKRSLDTGVELLHAHTPRTAMIASLVARRTGIPWVYHVHSPTVRDSTRFLQNWINDTVERISLYNADRMITVSKSLRREMLRRGWPRKRLIAIANGVSEQEPLFAIDRIESSQWTLGMVALIRPRKGIEVLLKALRELLLRNPSVRLDVIGSFETAEYESQVLELTRQLGIEHAVRWKGFTRDVTSALRELDVLVLPSMFGEGMPMVVLEALAVGLPVVATRVEGTPEVIRHGREGYLAEPSDPASLASMLEKMVGDRHTWCRMSEQAWVRHREAFSDRHMAQTVAATYELTLREAAVRKGSSPARQSQNEPRRSTEPRWILPHARRLSHFMIDT